MPKDLYEILGIKKGASDDEIKKAYRRLAQKHHPDRNKDDKESEKKFKEANQAYETLSDKQKRQYYDQFGSAGMGGSGFQGAPNFDTGAQFGNFDFADIFETFFGAQTGKRKKKTASALPGDDIEVSLDLNFETAAFGITKEINLARIITCDNCTGKGIEPGSKMTNCKTCNGTGEITSVRSTILGQIRTSRVCDECRGEGSIPEKPCKKCHSTTRIRETEKFKIKIPAGVDSGSVIRLAGKGNAGIRGGEVGDLYVHINVLSHKKFERNGFDVHSEEHIHLLQAVMGDVIEAETLHKKVKVRIPAGTQSGKVFRIKEYGVPRLRAEGRGDHYVKIIVDIPEKLSKREKELYLELAKESGLELSKDDSFFKKFF